MTKNQNVIYGEYDNPDKLRTTIHKCPLCEQKLRTLDTDSELSVKCPRCENVFKVQYGEITNQTSTLKDLALTVVSLKKKLAEAEIIQATTIKDQTESTFRIGIKVQSLKYPLLTILLGFGVIIIPYPIAKLSQQAETFRLAFLAKGMKYKPTFHDLAIGDSSYEYIVFLGLIMIFAGLVLGVTQFSKTNQPDK